MSDDTANGRLIILVKEILYQNQLLNNVRVVLNF